MKRILVLAVTVGLIGCVSEEVQAPEGDSPQQLDSRSISRFDKISLEPQYSTSARLESNAWNWSHSGCANGGTCYQPYSNFNWYGNGGYCTSYSWGNRCNSGWGYYGLYGWGWNFYDYWDQGEPDGTTLFWGHPYWCQGSDTWHGWSQSDHC